MKIDLQARGFVLTPALAEAVRREAYELDGIVGNRAVRLQVRLFDVNAGKGGVDKGCLVATRMGQVHRATVARSVDTDLYKAISTAFAKLVRGILAASDRERALRRSRRTSALADFS